MFKVDKSAKALRKVLIVISDTMRTGVTVFNKSQ